MNWYTLARRQVFVLAFSSFIGTSLSEPHTWETALCMCVCVYVCLYQSLNVNERIQIFHKDRMPTCTCKDYCRLQHQCEWDCWERRCQVECIYSTHGSLLPRCESHDHVTRLAESQKFQVSTVHELPCRNQIINLKYNPQNICESPQRSYFAVVL